MDSLSELRAAVSELEQVILYAKAQNTAVSKASVGWHIAHLLLTIAEILDDLRASKPKNYVWRPRPVQWFLLMTKSIPRGRAKAPERVKPLGVLSAQRLRLDLKKTQARLDEFAALSPNQFFTHPLLGEMYARTALVFTNIHTKHHLKIINDVLKQTK